MEQGLPRPPGRYEKGGDEDEKHPLALLPVSAPLPWSAGGVPAQHAVVQMAVVGKPVGVVASAPVDGRRVDQETLPLFLLNPLGDLRSFFDKAFMTIRCSLQLSLLFRKFAASGFKGGFKARYFAFCLSRGFGGAEPHGG